MKDMTHPALSPVQNSAFGWDAIVAPVYDQEGNEIPSDVARGVYRSDNGRCISTCGRGFKPIQHKDVVAPILGHFQDLGYALEERQETTRGGLYDLKGRKGAFIKTATARDGAVMRTDIITGDFINPTGSTRYLSQGEDTMLFKISVFNSHNGSLAVRVNTSYERLLCMNGMTRADFSAGVYGKHTTGFSIVAMQAQIDNALYSMAHDAETFGKWAKTRVTPEVAEAMLIKTIAKTGRAVSQRLVDQIMDQFGKEDQTAWGLYQAITYWQTHHKTKANASALTTQINRETRVASMLRSKEWLAITA